MKYASLILFTASILFLASCGQEVKNDHTDKPIVDTVPVANQFARIVSAIDSSAEYKQDRAFSSAATARAAMNFIFDKSGIVTYFNSTPGFNHRMSEYLNMLDNMHRILNSEPVDREALNKELVRLDVIRQAIVLRGSLGPGDFQTPLDKLSERIRHIIMPLIPRQPA